MIYFRESKIKGPHMDRGRLVWTLMGLGWYIGLSIALPVLGGWWLDGKVGTAPLFTLLGLGLGLVLALVGAYRTVRSIEEDQRGKKEKN